MLSLSITFAKRFASIHSTGFRVAVPCAQANMSTRSPRGRKPIRRSSQNEGDSSLYVPPPSPVPLDPADAWTEVQDKPSGMIYWWNTVTNETTALGVPKPMGSTALAQPMQQQQGGMGGGLGSVLAQGFAFGTGSAVAHNVIGSMFGGSSHDAPSTNDASDSSGDSWDV
jgi:hypothetical protein